MGNGMGNTLSNGYNLYFHPDVTPHPLKESKFDPNLGFEQPRQERKIKATIKEMESAKIELHERDYCIDYLLDFRKCRRDNFPWVVKCKHEKHAYLNCQYDDFVLRMKEFEREKRLMVREKRRQAAECA